MSASAFNRFSGCDKTLPAFSVPGLWVSAEAGLLNGIAVPAGTPLLPDVRGLLAWAVPPETPVVINFPGSTGAELKLGSLNTALTSLMLEESAWEDWVSVSPMDRDLAKELQRFPLEEAMEQDLRHLEAVCRQPRTHLEIYEERQLVSRARQIPVRAVNYLASHTEDWEGRTLRGVRPRRVITNVRDELYDIYENRVAARLIDHLTTYVRRRIARLRELRHGLETIDLHAQQPPSGMHWRQKRIYQLWGESLDLTEAQLLANVRLDELSSFLYRLERLRGSLLYTNVPAKLQVPAQLRVTNIFGNDPHYRRVARLWLSWHRHAHTGFPSLQEQQRTAQQEAAQFDRYAFLLTVHALEQFGFSPVASLSLKPGQTVKLTGPEGDAALFWNSDGTSSLFRDGVERLRIIASPASLSELRQDEIAQVITTLTQEAQTLSTQVILLYPGHASRTPAALQAVSGDPDRIHPSLSCLPISPIDLESVERLARAIRWVLTGERFRAYPPAIEALTTVPTEDLPLDLLRRSTGGHWKLTSPIPQYPASWLKESRRRQAELDSAEQELASSTHERLLMRKAQRAVEQRKSELEAWNAFLKSVEVSQLALADLRRCPVCGTPHATFSAWQDEQFNCKCEDCGAEWSLRVCQDCHQYHPWLIPQINAPGTVDTSPGWADRLFGRDVLTLPDPENLRSFACPMQNVSSGIN